RLTSEARIPSCPMAMASDTVMVLKMSGTAPASRTPSLAATASRASGVLAWGSRVPGRRHPDLGPLEVVVGEADGPQHRAGRGPVPPGGDLGGTWSPRRGAGRCHGCSPANVARAPRRR